MAVTKPQTKAQDKMKLGPDDEVRGSSKLLTGKENEGVNQILWQSNQQRHVT